MLENRRWLVIPTSLVSTINFNEVKESSADTLRYSLDGTKTFVKYDVTIVLETYQRPYINAETNEEMFETINAGVYGRPSFYSNEYDEYTHEEILELLSTSEWTNFIDR
jgi:hypothetical protein